MTLRVNQTVFMASDSCAISETNALSIRRGTPKCWKIVIVGLGTALVGCSGTFSVLQFIRYSFEWPVYNGPLPFTYDSSLQYLVKQVQPKLASDLTKRFVHAEGIPETYQMFSKDYLTDWTILLTIGSSSYVLYSDGDVESTDLVYEAIGSGAEIAKGAMHTLVHTVFGNNKLLLPWDILTCAYEAAVAHTSSVRGPLHIVTNL